MIYCRFCVVLVRRAVGSRAIVPRSSRVADALRRLQLDVVRPRVDILSFTQFTDKRWTLVVHCVPLEQVGYSPTSVVAALRPVSYDVREARS